MRILFRIAGMACVLGAGIWTGIEMDRGLKQRWLFLREVCEALQIFEKEMTWQRAAIPESLRSAARSGKTAFGAILLDCAQTAEEGNGMLFHEIWTGSVTKGLPAGLLNDTQIQELMHLDSALCNTDTVLQKAHLQRQLRTFTELCESAHEEWKEKGTLYRKLSAAASLAAVILLW
ncbi:MAG: stage III sporulation protein AB [Lachnospiraceae bacterium]|nr:stage III sporulation protein AB [Lachnospiraceae bacterium]